jgi:tetratricopeptide (TPR) repeat protein
MVLRWGHTECTDALWSAPVESPEDTLAELNDVQPALRHAVFLARAADCPQFATSAGHLGQAGFLVLRLVDLLLPGQPAPGPGADVFMYQASATERYGRELEGESDEKAHLLAVVKGARDAFAEGRPALVAPALFAYAHLLEEMGQYLEALDVLDTLLNVGGDNLSGADAIATTLRVARVNRKLASFDAAYAAYEKAGAFALAEGDTYSELLSRVGRVNIVFDRGNLAEAEHGYRDLVAAAQAARQVDAEARATHGLGATYDRRGLPAQAIPCLWRAFELYQDEMSKLRCLVGVGIMFRATGDFASAEQAFLETLRRSANTEVGLNVLLELMDCASARGDRLTYARWREECRRQESRLIPSGQVDFYLKQGIGDARFGNPARGLESLETGLALAQRHQLHEYVFRIERTMQELRDSNRTETIRPVEAAESIADEALNEVRASLKQLVGAGV